LRRAARQRTPRCTWNPDIDSPIKYMEGWNRVPDWQPPKMRSRCSGNFSSGMSRSVILSLGTCAKVRKACSLAELGLKSWAKRAWVEVPELAV
jgi:hypothetical protein